ncbi:pleckstrin homology domain-containing family G member 5 [Condylostylus longicornis]|uniref:pleckstrin homology domain-containing family G member 5 n=1 Tax=Condylostylus longicornis TaxID=2530218 RepID=UPI00244DB320|nr:pleckstrin homology domain-containing family G member 5 [Condylostylus longicornis]
MNKNLNDEKKVSSSEYFSVHFNKKNDCVEEELIQVKKGITLLEAIDSALKRRNLRASQINITDGYIYSGTEKGSPSYACSIDENIDTANLPGRILIVREKNDSYLKSSKAGGLQKAASFGSRTRPSRLLSSASTEETSSEPDPKTIPAKQLKQRWSGLFGVKNPQQNQLCELLSKFSKSGGPPKKYNIKLEHQTCETDALKYLKNSHKCWREFIYYENLPDNEIKIQSAIWELVTTEIDYINTLQTVTDLFLACLEAIQEENILADVDQNKLFSNIREICESNIKFWASYLFPMVANSIANGSPLQIDYFEQGFVTFGSVFSSYKVYCAEQSTCQFYCKDLNRTNTVFTTYLAWCESQKNCNRLRLADILVRPMQRLTKYSLLLIAIRKHIVIENDGEMLDSMIRSVENFVYSVNNHLSTRQENERLKGIMARIESYDVVETNNEQLEKLVKQYSQMFDLCAPMKGCSSQHCRHLFMEGDLKLKDSASKSDVHCFLLTDILLICKTISKKNQGTLKVIRQPYFTDRLVIKYKDNSLHCIYLNEFQVPTSAFSLQCSEAKNWHDGITKAKHIYTRLKQNIQLDINLRGYNQSTSDDNVNILCVRKSPLNSSKGSRISSLNNSHSGSVELNDSKNISIDFEKANSLSSDESTHFNNQHTIQKTKSSTTVDTQKQKTATANTLSVEPLHSLGQSLPNLTSPHNQVSNNTLLVPEYGRGCSKNNLLSSNHRGISYPPPSPTRATLRRGLAFSSTIKNPPLLKSRNITSQNSVNSCQGLLLKTENKVMQHQQDGSSHFPDLSSFASSDSEVSSNPTQKTNPNSNTSAVTPRNSTLNLAQSPNETNV